jgi:CHAT domain-containing protein/Tfp pilus assembly protein PilF
MVGWSGERSLSSTIAAGIMSWGPIPSVRLAGLVLLGAGLCYAALARNPADPEKLTQEADRLAWLKAWTKAEPLYTQAGRLFTRRGDRRNALYAQIGALRGQLPRLAVPDVSERLAAYLDDPLVQRDDRLRLRALVIKGDTDVDLDPMLAEQSWREALSIAEKLGESAWANRARGELGLVAFLQGDINTAVVSLGQALKVAESNGDTPSVVRWLTLFGHGYLELGRAEQAIEFYDRALKIAATVPELQFPLMTYLGKGNALVKLGRLDTAGQVLDDALAVATSEGALGYQAELLLKQGLIAYERKETQRARDSLSRAAGLARRAGGGRILAEIALDLARIQRDSGQVEEADRTLREGVAIARAMAEQILLPRLLAQLADLRISQQRYEDAAVLLQEASELLEGLLTNASSPWTRSRVISGMDSVFQARIRLEGLRGEDPSRMFTVLEQVRGRSLLELLLSTPLSDVAKPPELRAAERRIAALQSRLLRAQDQNDRERLLDEIFRAEEQLALISTELFTRTRTGPRAPVTLQDVQAVLRADEVLLEFASAEPRSFTVVATRSTARMHQLPGRQAIYDRLEPLLKSVRQGGRPDADAKAVGELLLSGIPEISTAKRLIVSADGDLHQLPFELLIGSSGRRLLESHIVTYIPSGSVLAILRNRSPQPEPSKMALAMSASPTAAVSASALKSAALGSVARGVYDIEAGDLPPLPSANDEARTVGALLGPAASTILLGESASELALKRQPLQEYRVLHFAVHGIVSTSSPGRSALLLRPADPEDGLLQAREILEFRLAAGLVTLSACETAAGTVHGQEGVASLVRPFLAAGARTVVANLWTADDRFSFSLMREFYRELATGVDVADALRRAKLTMLKQYGASAPPQFWSGVLVHGDGTGVVTPVRAND